jgi:hypothetical protein
MILNETQENILAMQEKAARLNERIATLCRIIGGANYYLTQALKDGTTPKDRHSYTVQALEILNKTEDV